MADPLQIRDDMLAALKALRDLNGRVHDGYVPDKIPTDTGGYVLPYVVFHGGGGDNPDEPSSDGKLDSDVLVYDFQTTSVGPSPGHAIGVDQLIKGALQNLTVGTGRIRPNPDGFNQQTPIRDPNITPARFMLPRQWRLITN